MNDLQRIIIYTQNCWTLGLINRLKYQITFLFCSENHTFYILNIFYTISDQIGLQNCTNLQSLESKLVYLCVPLYKWFLTFVLYIKLKFKKWTLVRVLYMFCTVLNWSLTHTLKKPNFRKEQFSWFLLDHTQSIHLLHMQH